MMNRRNFFGAVGSVVSFGYAASRNGQPASFGVDAPPKGFPEFNWIDFPQSIIGIMPMRREQLVSCVDGIYELNGCQGPFHFAGRRLWAMHVDQDMARVSCWRRI